MEQSLSHYIKEYHKQLKLGIVQKAFKGLIGYILSLRTRFINQYPEGYVVGSLHQGYMDISYFPFTPTELNCKKLKVSIVYNHRKAQFKIWLVGQNKKVQRAIGNLSRAVTGISMMSNPIHSMPL